MKTITAKVREYKLNPILQNHKLVYETHCFNICNYQLSKFNRLWTDLQRNIPYYQQLVQNGSVPAEIICWDDFANFPNLTRASIQEDVTKFIDYSQEIAGWATTGGSTGTPFRVPYWSSDAQAPMLNSWLGRGFYGIQVSDRMFHLWGHSHLFGSGWKRHVKQFKRQIKNRLLGYRVFSAYHLTPQRLRQAGQAIIDMRPDFIMGYSRSLTLLAKENADRADSYKKMRIKAVIGTTESFSNPGDAQTIEQVFGCPVGMEYGAAETGVMAYTHPADGRYRVFWDSYLLEAVPINDTDAKLLVTSLYPRAMPLVRYDIGDSVRNYEISGNSIVGFAEVLGRDNDLIETKHGSFVHPVALIHCAQYVPGVLGLQVVQEKDKSVSFNVLCEEPLSKENEMIIRRNLATLDSRLSDCAINYEDCLEQTVAGKTKWVIKR